MFDFVDRILGREKYSAKNLSENGLKARDPDVDDDDSEIRDINVEYFWKKVREDIEDHQSKYLMFHIPDTCWEAIERHVKNVLVDRIYDCEEHR